MNRLLLTLLVITYLVSCKTTDQNITITQNGQSKYRIIYSDKAPSDLLEEIMFFKEGLKLMTGVDIPVLSDIVGKQAEEILIGATNRNSTFENSIPLKALGKEGYFAGVRGKSWVITSNSTNGITNGLYDILGKLGATKMAENITQYANKKTLMVEAKDITHVPAFSYRQAINPHALNAEYRKWNHLNIDNQMDWGTWGYSAAKIFTPESYFKSNPDYFASVNGKFIPDQFNFSNKSMEAALEKNLEVWSMAKGRAPYWSISPTENHIVSEDDLTQQSIKETGSAAGALLKLVNSIAEKKKDRIHAVWLDGPYRVAPSNIKPAENVMIVLDTKDVNHAASLEENIWNEPFRTDLTGWKKITTNIAVVSHVTNEKNFMMPFPCLNALQGSLKYLKKEGVDKIIFSGVSGPGAPMANLNFFVAASLAWNIDQSVDSLIWKYCDNHYGPAAKSMYGYYKALETAVASGNVMLSMDQSPAKAFKSWLTPNNINQLYSYFNPLAAMTQENSLLKEKIDRDRLSLIYSQLEVAKSMGTNTFGYFMNFGALKASLVRQDKPIGKTGGDEEFKGIKDADFRPIQGMRDLLDKFVQDCYDNAIRVIDSKGTTPEQYRDLTLKYMTQKVQSHAGFKKGTILLNSVADAEYGDGDGAILNDGASGLAENPYSNWLGLKGGNSELTWDLGRDTTLSSLSLRFLQSPTQRAYLPNSVSVQVSSDGNTFSDISTKSIASASGTKTESMSISFGKNKIRAIKIKMKSPEKCSAETVCAGDNAVVLMDEIVLR